MPTGAAGVRARWGDLEAMTVGSGVLATMFWHGKFRNDMISQPLTLESAWIVEVTRTYRLRLAL